MRKQLIQYSICVYQGGRMMDSHKAIIQGDAYSAYLSFKAKYPDDEVCIRANGELIEI